MALHPLVELSNCSDPSKIQDPRARRALIHCVQQLRKHLTSECWPEPFQLAGIAYGELAGDRFIIGDEPGLGKTIQALCRLIVRPRYPTVVVTTASTLYNWKTESEKWIPRVPFYLLDGVHRRGPPPGWQGIVGTTWGLLETHQYTIAALRPVLMIADEAHNVVNPEAHRSIAMARLASMIRYVILLTGTPFRNNAKELWNLLNLLDPVRWPDEDAFSDVSKAAFDSGQLTRLQMKVRQYMIRRLKVDAQPNLPSKHYRVEYVQLPPAALAEYKYVEKNYEQWLFRQTEIRVKRERVKLGAVEITPELHEEVDKRVTKAMKAEHLTRMNALRSMIGRLKIPAAVEWAVRMHQAGEPAVMFAEHQDVVDGIAAGLRARSVPFLLVVGATKKEERQAAKAKFQAGEASIFLASKAAKEGITLTRARHVALVEEWYTAADEDQGADRIHRMTQKRNVVVWKFHALDTIDVRTGEINKHKRMITERVIGGTPLRPLA